MSETLHFGDGVTGENRKQKRKMEEEVGADSIVSLSLSIGGEQKKYPCVKGCFQEWTKKFKWELLDLVPICVHAQILIIIINIPSLLHGRHLLIMELDGLILLHLQPMAIHLG
ncbi:hypothetical protein TSUD_229850 [Trifolium subterraneum]|uniref:Uncharacterized protein n=1 Tax=Trifolium subterraneum TaxID=3900 RepID=A0A2Z6LJX5_TRISU|nr:hypothetical protein TSUD_229850 [Trifolium subterraneum]